MQGKHSSHSLTYLWAQLSLQSDCIWNDGPDPVFVMWARVLCGQGEVGRTVVMQFKLYMENEDSRPHSLLLTVSSSVWICLRFKFPEYYIDSCCNTLTCAHPGFYYFMAIWYLLSLPTSFISIYFIMASSAEKLLCFICLIFHKPVDGRGDMDPWTSVISSRILGRST